MTVFATSEHERGTAWRSLAGLGCGLAGVLVLELLIRLSGFRPASPAVLPTLAVIIGGLVWGLAGGLAAAAVVVVSVLAALTQPGRFFALDQPAVIGISLALPLFAGALTGGARDYFIRRSARQLGAVESRLHSYEKRYHDLVVSLPDALATCSEGRLVYVNPAFVRLAGGADAQEFVGRRLSEFVRADGNSALDERSRVEAGRMMSRDGSVRQIESTWFAVQEDGRTLDNCVLRDVSAQVRREEALRASEARFKSLTDLTSDWYWEQDDQLRFVAVGVDSNQQQSARFSFSGEKMPWENPTTSLSEEQWLAHRAVLAAHKPFQNLEYSRVGADGERRWVSVSGAPIFDAGGRFTGYRGVVRDISAQKRAERLRALEHAIARSLAEAHDAATALQSVIRAICETEHWEWGQYWRFEEAAGVLRAAEFWAPADASIRCHLEAASDVSMGPGVGLSGHVLRSGEPLWVVDVLHDPRVLQKALVAEIGIHGAFLFPVRAEEKILGVLSFSSQEVRAPDERLLAAVQAIGSQMGQFLRRMQAEEDLRRFRVALDHSADMILLIDRTTMRYVDVNETACRLLGYARAELVGMGPQDVLPVSREALERSYDALLADPSRAGSLRSEYLCKDGSRLPFESTRHVIRSGDGYLIAAISRDIRERLSAEAEAREASERIERLNEQLETRVRERTAELEALVQELESFTYTISHDLRAPLRAMNGFAQIVLQKHIAAMPPDAQRMLTRIHANARRMSDLVDGLLAFARLGRGAISKTKTPMHALAEQSWAELAPERKGRRIELEMGTLPPCDGDPVLLKQVWANLLSNAVKYTRDHDPARIAVGWDPVDACYFVRDNGAGFDMQYADKLFGVFSRLHADEEFEGTGLGLAICERILRRHGGRIRAEAKPGEGAAFYFSV